VLEHGKKCDLVVIGSGPAGQYAALQAAKRRLEVCVVERRQMVGGSCLHVGTLPSKTLRESVLYLTGWRLRNKEELTQAGVPSLAECYEIAALDAQSKLS